MDITRSHQGTSHQVEQIDLCTRPLKKADGMTFPALHKVLGMLQVLQNLHEISYFPIASSQLKWDFHNVESWLCTVRAKRKVITVTDFANLFSLASIGRVINACN
jgi:hypothetical protein